MIQKAFINPKMMKWASEYVGFVGGYEEELPKQIRDKYESWENGEKVPTWNQLYDVSKKFNVPTAYFFMRSPPIIDSMPDLIDYRTLNRDFIYKITSPYLISNIRKSQSRREIYVELSQELGEDVTPFSVPDLKRDTKLFSRYLRKTLDIQKYRQGSSDTFHNNFLNQWKEILNEKLCLLVFESKNVDVLEMSGRLHQQARL